MGNKAQFLTKSVFLFIILVFYAVVAVFVGLSFGDADSGISVASGEDALKDFCILGICASELGFAGNIIIGFTNVPLWINAVIFTPLVLTLGFIFITSLPTMSGGS